MIFRIFSNSCPVFPIRRFVAALAICALAIQWGTLLFAAREVDRNVLSESRERVRALLLSHEKALLRVATDYAWWDEPIQKIIIDHDRAWSSANLGDTTLRNYDLAALCVIDADINVVHHAHREGRGHLAAEASEILRPQLQEAVRFPHLSSPAEGHYVLIGQNVFFASYAPLSAVDLPSGLPKEQRGVFLLLRAIDGHYLQDLEETYQTERLALSSEQPKGHAAITLAILNSGPAFIHWPPRSHGRLFLQETVPGLTLGTIFLSVLVYLGARTLARVSDRLRQEREQATTLATRDSLTGLCNRRCFEDRLQRLDAEARQPGKCGVVMFIDLDGFKSVNDRYGHAAGDQLLKEVGSLLDGRMREADIVARLGGDEFVAALVLPTSATERIKVIAERLLGDLNVMFAAQGYAFVSATIGIASCPGDAASLAEAVAVADTTMYRAKQAGKGRVDYASICPAR